MMATSENPQSDKNTLVPVMDSQSLSSMLVESGGKAWLLDNNHIKNEDTNMCGMMVELDQWSAGFGNFTVFWLDPDFRIRLATDTLFSESPTATFAMTINLIDVDFGVNSWMTPWKDGAAMIRRKEIEVEPASVAKELGEGFPWSYRIGVYAPNTLSATIYLQFLPLPLSTIASSIWANDAQLLGIVQVVAEDVSWFNNLPDSEAHLSPSPFIVDRRQSAFKTVLPSSQLYRDAVLAALIRACQPQAITKESAAQMNPASVRVDPRVGDFARAVEVPRAGSTADHSGTPSLVESSDEHDTPPRR